MLKEVSLWIRERTWKIPGRPSEMPSICRFTYRFFTIRFVRRIAHVEIGETCARSPSECGRNEEMIIATHPSIVVIVAESLLSISRAIAVIRLFYYLLPIAESRWVVRQESNQNQCRRITSMQSPSSTINIYKSPSIDSFAFSGKSTYRDDLFSKRLHMCFAFVCDKIRIPRNRNRYQFDYLFANKNPDAIFHRSKDPNKDDFIPNENEMTQFIWFAMGQ